MTTSAEPSTPSGSAAAPQRRRQITSYKNTTSSPATDRRGLETTERAARAKLRPTLTGPVRVGLNTCVGRGEETGFQVEQRNWNGGSGEWYKIYLTSKAPYKACSAFTRVAACTL